MKQIYEKVLTLVVKDSSLYMNGTQLPYDRYSQIGLHHKYDSIEPLMARAFICMLVALNQTSDYNHVEDRLSFRKISREFGHKNTYMKWRDYLMDNHIICNDGSKRRFILNPEYNPSFTTSDLNELSETLTAMSKERVLHPML